MNKRKYAVTLLFLLMMVISTYARNDKTFQRIVQGSPEEPVVLGCEYPEFAFHFPQMAGNFRLGIQDRGESSWINDSKNIIVTEKKGKLTYVVKHKLLKNGKLIIRVSGLANSKGLIMEIESKDTPPTLQLIWSFGGCYGKILADKKDSQMKAIYCKDNVFSIEGNCFTCYYGESMKLKVIQGVTPPDSEIRLSDAHQQETPVSLFQSGKITDAPALSGSTPMLKDKKLYFSFYVQNKKADYNYFMLPTLFLQNFNQ